MGLMQALKSLDSFPRAEEHLLQKSKSGALVSIVGLVIMATLFFHELTYYLSTYTVHQVFEGSSHVNMSHIIHNLSFRPEYPGIHNPLDGTMWILRGASGTFKYYIKPLLTLRACIRSVM
ncbi:Endoplasmic reticulum vesicle transporter protein [Forsythia ovata]|uniref:Endoplasmic reticulum vesicle transporter protein n=1 Tax=Forsythia ovata TaxID=205694 RepID=A0ABD1RL09_9LAMI